MSDEITAYPGVWPPAPIKTERLVLRQSEARDRSALIDLFALPEVGIYVGGARLVRRHASRRAGGALYPDCQRGVDARRGEARVHRGGAVRGIRCRAVARGVVPTYAVRLSLGTKATDLRFR